MRFILAGTVGIMMVVAGCSRLGGSGAGASDTASSDSPGNRSAQPSSHKTTSAGGTVDKTADSKSGEPEKVEYSEAEWRKRLSDEQYHVLREKGTERAFTGKYWDTKTKGQYMCAGCGAVLFTSDQKFDSGCGWPSFSKAADERGITETKDLSHGMARTEVTCTRCGGHLGHVFDDGPGPTHLRYCINSASIDLKPDGKPGPGVPAEAKGAATSKPAESKKP